MTRKEELEKTIDFDDAVNRIVRLEKENAELKADNAEWEKASDKWKSVYELTNNQLTKAKELLERLLITSCNSDVLNLLPNRSEVLRVRVEAEQFLSEKGGKYVLHV